LRKMVLRRWRRWWGVGAVGAGSVPGGARFGVLRAGEGRVPRRGHVGRGGKVPVAGQRRLVGRRRAGRRRAGRRRAGRGRGVGQQPPPWPVAGEGAPRREVGGKVVAFQGFLERAAEVHLWAPNRPWVRYPTGE
jgi:hypothetical protein